ncbi:MAG: hypothetical protein KGJ62_07400 [Armatimonadetes bacterium]|nr:hypothetical protein [Armatimonadota bacterium]MDE2207770.1 hypothetical protein [Armatimonadota bacterium]
MVIRLPDVMYVRPLSSLSLARARFVCVARRRRRSLTGIAAAAATLGLAAATTSCGGGGAPAVAGAVRTTINWPQRSRAINALASSLSLVVTFKGAAANGGDFTWTINRAGGAGAYSQPAATPGPVHYGSVKVSVNSFAQPDGQGSQTGSGIGAVLLKPGAGGAQLPGIQLATAIEGISAGYAGVVPPFTYVLLQVQVALPGAPGGEARPGPRDPSLS